MKSRHASHEACELKLYDTGGTTVINGHASHEACELKLKKFLNEGEYEYVTPRMRRVS